MIGAAIAMMLAPAVPAGLAPTSQWLIDDKEQCTLSRDYDSSGAQLTVGLRTAPFVQAIRLLVVTQGAGTAPTSGRAMVTLFSGEPIDIRYGSYRTTADVRRVVVMAMGTEAMAGLEASRTLSVAIGDEAPITVQLAGIKAGLAMLKTCSDTLLRRWGVDQAEADRIATPAVPIGDPGTWITSEDYPSSALRAERQGSVLIVWTIGLDGAETPNWMRPPAARSSGVPAISRRPAMTASRCYPISAAWWRGGYRAEPPHPCHPRLPAL
jgi:hypothetical protein